MNLPVLIRDDAARDIEEAAQWYETQRQGLGHSFLDEVRAAIDLIVERPERFPVVTRNTRRALIRRFPYGVFYRIEPDALVVVALFHASRSPRIWKRRT